MNGTLAKIRRLNPPMYTTVEAARLVGRSQDTLVRWRKLGVYSPRKKTMVGDVNVWLYTDEDIMALRSIAKTMKPGRKKG